MQNRVGGGSSPRIIGTKEAWPETRNLRHNLMGYHHHPQARQKKYSILPEFGVLWSTLTAWLAWWWW